MGGRAADRQAKRGQARRETPASERPGAEWHERLVAVMHAQADLLRAVASGRVPPAAAKHDYDLAHAELMRWFHDTSVPCFCPWPNVFAWAYGPDVAGGWEAYLDKRLSEYCDSLSGSDEEPEYEIRLYMASDGTGSPYTRFVRSLSEAKQAVLDTAIRTVLKRRGPAVTTDSREGRTISRKGTKVIEWKPRDDAQGLHARSTQGSVEGADHFDVELSHGRFGQEDVKLRVFFTVSEDNAIVLLRGYDKGVDDSDKRQQAEIHAAFKHLRDYRLQEQRARAAVRTGRG